MFTGGHEKEFIAERSHPTKFRYPDGCWISKHPDEEEIHAHFDFWYAQADAEQREVYDAMRDVQVIQQFRDGPPKMQTLSASEAMDRAIKFWTYYYAAEVDDFMLYVQHKRETLAKANGMDKAGIMQYVGAMPQRIQHFMKLYQPELIVTNNGERVPKAQELFFKKFTKARIANV